MAVIAILALTATAAAQFSTPRALNGTALQKGKKAHVPQQPTGQLPPAGPALPAGVSFLVGGSDSCSSAAATNAITGPGTYTVNTTGATSGSPTGSCGGIGNDVWFYYSAATTSNVQVSTCGGVSADSVIAVWADGVPAGSCPTTQITCLDDYCGLQTTVSFAATAGARYFLELGGYFGATYSGTFTIVELGSSPGSDSCLTPTAIAGAGPHAYDNSAATTGTEGQTESICSFFGSTVIDHDIWYTWTAGTSGLHTWDFCAGGSGDPKIALYNGAGCPSAGTAVACNDDSCGLVSSLCFHAVAGNTYTLQVGTFPGASGGSGTFTIAPTAAGTTNDDCAAATPISGLGPHNWDTTVATTSCQGQNNALCEFFGTTAIDQDVWFTWVAPSTNLFQVATCGLAGGFDSKIAVYLGAGCPTATAIACGDDGCGTIGGETEACFQATAGASYTIQVGAFPGAGGTTGQFVFSILAPPPSGCQYDNGTSENALGLTAGGALLWLHRFGQIGITTTVSSISSAFGSALYPSTFPVGTPCIAAIWDDPTDDSDPTDAVLLQQVSGVVGNAYNDVLDTFPLSSPQNATGQFFVGVSAVHAAGEYIGPMDQDNCPSGSGGRAWAAGDNSGVINLVTLAANNVPPLEMDAAGYPAVWLLRADCSTSSAPPNDSCSTATSIAGSGSFAYDNRFATPTTATAPPSACAASQSRDIWYSWTSQGAGLVTVSTCGGPTWNPVVTVYTGGCGSLTEIACDDDACTTPPLGSRVTFTCACTTTYVVRIASFGSSPGAQGVFTVSAPGFVDTDGDGVNDCIDNCPSIVNPTQLDCDANGIGDVCDLAGGAPDCNANGNLDSCDIASGTSADLNHDGIPDECLPTFTGDIHIPGTSASAVSLFVHDDGSGNRLYAAGEFEAASTTAAGSIARWNGVTGTWSTLGSGVSGGRACISTMASFDEDGPGGSSARLFAAGCFTHAGGTPALNIARWNGTSWSAVGAGLDDQVMSLIVFDDDAAGPHAPVLVASGLFKTAGTGVAMNIARWNGSNWSPLGTGTDGPVMCLAVFDTDGTGPLAPQLYAGGYFLNAGGLVTNGIARWNGTSWLTVSSGVGHPVQRAAVLAMAAYDEDGAGSQPARLFIGGSFTTAGGLAQSCIARWNGTSFSPGMAGGGMTASGSFPLVRALGTFNDGSGDKLYAAGQFRTAGGASVAPDPLNPSPFLIAARWNGSTWTALGTGVGANADAGGRALAFFDDDGNGTASIFVAGQFGSIGNIVAAGIARWSGSSWQALGIGRGVSAAARCITPLGGGGNQLVVGGDFTTAGNVRANRIAVWTDTTSSWSALGVGLSGSVNAIEVAGSDIYAGGEFEFSGTTPVANVARWSGTVWSALGSGTDGPVNALDSFGGAIIAGGYFGHAGGVGVSHIAAWNGSTWTPLGTGLNDAVRALEVFDDSGGTTPKLFAGGDFLRAGSIAASAVARWDGASWTALGGGLQNGSVYDLALFDDGSGRRLYAAGNFDSDGDQRLDAIARWNFSTQTWEPVGTGFRGGLETRVDAMTTWVVGGTSRLVVGGDFTSASGVAARNLALLSGGVWTPLGAGIDDRVLALQARSVTGGQALFAGGEFSLADSVPSSRFARHQ